MGDPIEFESIRKVFGEPHRRSKLYVASVKGNIGHLEGASGVAGLIKVLLMMQKRAIPIQANFTKLNPKILPLDSQQIEIPQHRTKEWNSDRRVACINNYGAAGSNAAMIVCEAPKSRSSMDVQVENLTVTSRKYPIFISAKSPTSLLAYCEALRRYCAGISASLQLNTLRDLSFNLASRQNHELPYFMSVASSSLTELQSKLTRTVSEAGRFEDRTGSDANSTILVFGGQVSDTMCLDRSVYEASTILKSHLDSCDSVICSIGLNSIYPGIFQAEPVRNIVELHCMLFALQYSCARTWLDSGLQVSALLGHSFGQLTALCVAGSMTLLDGLKLVSGRAFLMQNAWGCERGSMVAIEADLDTVLHLISSVNGSHADYFVEIACYNGPTSHVLVGSQASIRAIEYIAADSGLYTGAAKLRKLNVTYGFHSRLTESILPGLTRLAEELTFNEPEISLETCNQERSWKKPTPQLIAEHTRSPVYFEQAVKRLVGRLGPCTWVEAGSGSSVINMIRRALDSSHESSNSYQSLNLSTAHAFDSLTDVTVNLWKIGHQVQFWPFHRSRRSLFKYLNLPPYQFEKPRHWLKWVDRAEINAPAEPQKAVSEPTLISFMRFKDRSHSEAEFQVDAQSTEYKVYVEGHRVVNQPLCPAPLYVELAARAGLMLIPGNQNPSRLPYIEDLEIKAPLGMAADREVIMVLKRTKESARSWNFELKSQPSRKFSEKGDQNPVSHAKGIVLLREDCPKIHSEFNRYERLVNADRLQDLRDSSESQVLQGPPIYKLFSRVVTYADYYKGVISIASKNHEVIARVALNASQSKLLQGTITQPLAVDNFIQVAGLHVNCLNDCGDNEVYVCTKVDSVQLGNKFNSIGLKQDAWTINSSFSPVSDREVVNDIFVFDSAAKDLVLIVLGAHFSRVLIPSLTKALARANLTTSSAAVTVGAFDTPPKVVGKNEPILPAATTSHMAQARTASVLSAPEVRERLRSLLCEVADLLPGNIKDDSTLEALGIDSLVVTEVVSEIQKKFDIMIDPADFQNLSDVRSIQNYVALNLPKDPDATTSLSSSSASTVDSYSDGDTPDTSTDSSVVNVPLMQHSCTAELAKLVSEHLELAITITPETNLTQVGLDSLLSIELANDIKEKFGAFVDLSLLNENSVFGDLLKLVQPSQKPATCDITVTAPGGDVPPSDLSANGKDNYPKPTLVSEQPVLLSDTHRVFEDYRYGYDSEAKESGFAGFWRTVYPLQARLVLAYVVEAYSKLGCPLASLSNGDMLPRIKLFPQHSMLIAQLEEILVESSLVSRENNTLIRSRTPVNGVHSSGIFEQILVDFPQHASEHRLLNITGSKLAECLVGSEDPLRLLFKEKSNKELLEEVYTNGPMYAAITKLLGSFLVGAFTATKEDGKLHILELGGGTGGTTKHVVNTLSQHGIPFTYTFTDISGSLVAAARRKFTDQASMEFMVLDIEKPPPEKFIGHFHTVISTNCVHATRNLTTSASNIRRMLRDDGFVSLVEFTRNISWFDLVFGLLEGWWLFEDGRRHVLATEHFWENSLKSAGFGHIAWTDGESEEARTIRIITAFRSQVTGSDSSRITDSMNTRTIPMETVLYKKVDQTSLYADIYYPSDNTQTRRPVGMILYLNLIYLYANRGKHS